MSNLSPKNLIDRPTYLNQLKRFREKDVIKITTGIRRCGKSTLYDLFADYLLKDGIAPEQIIRLNLTDGEHEDIRNYSDLFSYIKSNLVSDKMNYVFLDEIQIIENFEKACLALYSKKNVDLYITGSNSTLLSSELSTLLTGRFVEIKMLPLSFKEYVSWVGGGNLNKLYNNYITRSSFPGTLSLETTADVRMYLDGIYSSIVLKDVVQRYHISDTAGLNRLTKYMYDNIGNLFSATTISLALAATGRKISSPTVDAYIENLKSAFMLYEARRYDIKGKDYLKAPTKYYIPDIGLRFFLLGSKITDYGFILENLVYLELLRRGYDVSVGKLDDKEVDFVALDKNREPIYIQVAYSVLNETTFARAIDPLKRIKDNYQKLILTQDDLPPSQEDGIKVLPATSWLLESQD